MQIKYNKIDGEMGRKLDKLFGVDNCLIEVNPGAVLLPPKYQDIGERILNLEVRPDDVWLISYPRTGSTWTQEMVWCIKNDLNFEGAKVLAQLRNPLLELTALVGNDSRDWKNELGDSVEMVEKMSSPRFIKTHLPWELLPKQLQSVKPKIVYVARNPKDISVSYYHYCELMHGFHGSFNEFCEILLLGKAPLGDVFNHILGFWTRRNEPNILFIKFEDMKKDHRKVIKDVTEFLDKTITENQVSELENHLSFNSMKKNPAVNLEPILGKMYGEGPEKPQNTFIRKGVIGDWKNYMTADISEKFDEMIWKKLEKNGLVF